MYIWGKSQGCILSITLVFIAVVVTPSAIPTLKEDVSANLSPVLAPSNKHLPRVPIMHHISAGVHTAIGGGWIITTRIINSVVIPVQTMASVLEYFFQEALVQVAMRGLQNRPLPGNTLKISIGSVNLTLRAVNPGGYLTWEACEEIVAKLLLDVQLGFTAQFTSEWSHPASGTLLYVSLEVLQRVAVGPVEEAV